ncbi:YOL087C [Saccharomyces arboricola H-6]|uniref:YOL087C n=1 Tax=Saccharomyces arboricola (strain H-6 / AS 2.3317 / CBS 10644) TaxID=1160507 RepID=J8PZK2_SACAR|nr:YOL087C [Saccharomyces arboricola H-6]
MNQLTVSYGLISPDYCTSQDAHILPITKILFPDIPGKDYFLTSGRDGSIILHKNTQLFDEVQSETVTTPNDAIRMQVHSDWASDLIHVNTESTDLSAGDTFISVSHDFSIVLISVNAELTIWDKKIIGDHDDYIKCIVPIHYDMSNGYGIDEQGSDADASWDETNNRMAIDEQNYFLFATGGLDRKIKIWCLSNGPDKIATLLHTFDNAQPNDTGSIYSMSSVIPKYNFGDDQTTRPFDLVAGDCNGDLIFYSCKDRKEVMRIENAHKTNIKVVRTLNDFTRLITTSSDGVISVWDLNCMRDEDNGALKLPTKVGSWSWDSSIWCVQGTCLDQLYFGDSQGNVMRANLSSYQNAKLTRIFKPNRHHQHNEIEGQNISNNGDTKAKKCGGILDIALLPNEKLLFSFCTDSNLNELDLASNRFNINEGGFALTRSSLLTNRRHVITENTKGQMQRWDIVSCELLNTFDPSEGSFDDIVMKYTSKEILSHWCTVSVKVGMLFVKINPKFLKTEIYGSALKGYEVVNNMAVSSDERYNLGKIVINSLFNEFISYEVQKDKLLRKKIFSSRKKDLNNSLTLDTGNNTELKKNNKDKKRKSTFKLSSTLSIGNTSGAATPPNSAPTTPVMTESIVTEEQPLLQFPVDKVIDDSLELVQPSPASKKQYFRTQSSGSLLSRKFKSFRSTSGRATTGLNTPEESKGNLLDTAHIINDDSSIPHIINTTQPSKDATPESILWNHPFKLEQKLSAISSHDLPNSNVHNKVKSAESSRANSTPTLEGNEKKPPEFMPELLEQIQESYKQQYMNTSSLKYLTKRLPVTKIIKASSCPIIKVKSVTLILVHLWKEGSCGGRVLFSTLLPPSRIENESSNGGKENSRIQDDEELDFQAIDDDKLGQYDHIDGELGNRLNRRQIFEQLEENLPYWFAKALFRDIKIVEEQPKLNFLIMPWSGDGRSETNGNAENKKKENNMPDTTESSATDSSDSSLSNTNEATSPSAQQQFHNMLKFGRPKTNEQELNPTDLPKISEANVKLVAPGMIRVKKIKLYVADRFESKTPEMKAKIEPSTWLDLLCKGQVLDNDMTLNTVRTLYWKSQGDIILEYRRKVHSSPLVHEFSENEGK